MPINNGGHFRRASTIPYQNMLSKNTFHFLKEVAINNNREWFAVHKPEYEVAKTEVINLAAALIKAIASIDPLIASDADPKKTVMRIYRDVRFSKNKDPYKKNIGVWISAKSKGGDEPGYYLHLEPNNSFVAGGYWMPTPPHLKLIRQEIDYNMEEFLAIVNDKTFAEHFKLSTANALKNAPKGYDPNDPNIEFLKLKSFEVLRKLEDKAFFEKDIVDKLKSYYTNIYPLIAFLRNAIEQ